MGTNLSKLAKTPRVARRWEPSGSDAEDILAAVANGYGIGVILVAVRADGHKIERDRLVRWIRDNAPPQGSS